MSTQQPIYQSAFERHRACVLVPTYNNAGTLPGVLNGLLKYTSDIIVVNDGSTDHTPVILKEFQSIRIVSYGRNKGKGFALRTGICEAAKLGYEYAIAIDSDGQHYPEDLAVFLDKLEEVPGALIVGARNMEQAGIPGKSSFGKRFSNFWYWVTTGKHLPDTQSGYRLYPVQKLAGKKWFSKKYEFEVEVLVRATWSGITVSSVPVSVYYPRPEERISHFRPFRDFTRISVLNTFLVIVALLWIKPRDLFRTLSRRQGWKALWKALFIRREESNHLKAASVGFGVFMGIVPVWGFQMAIGIPLSILFRLNKALFLVAVNISIFPVTPLIWLASLATGKWLLHDQALVPGLHDISLERVKQEGEAFFLGGAVLAIAAGIIAFLLTYIILFLTRRKKHLAT